MNLPWVSREMLNLAERRRCDAIAEHEAEVAFVYRQLDAANERIAFLLDRVLPVPASPVTATSVREPREPSVIAQTIRDESAGDIRLAAHLRKRARELKAEKPDWKPEQIAEELRNWQTTATDGLT